MDITTTITVPTCTVLTLVHRAILMEFLQLIDNAAMKTILVCE